MWHITESSSSLPSLIISASSSLGTPTVTRSTTGTPNIVLSPAGYGVEFTESSATENYVWTFDIPDPCVCPFRITECPQGLTVSFWYYYVTPGPTVYYKQMVAISEGNFYFYRNYGAGTVNHRLNYDNTYSWASTIYLLSDGWYHISIVFDGSSLF